MLCCLFVLCHVYSTVRSTAFTTKDIVVSGSDDRTVKVWFTFLQFLITEIATMEDSSSEWDSCRYCSLLFILVNLLFLLIRLPIQAVSLFFLSPSNGWLPLDGLRKKRGRNGVSRVSWLRRSRARGLPSLNQKIKRDLLAVYLLIFVSNSLAKYPQTKKKQRLNEMESWLQHRHQTSKEVWESSPVFKTISAERFSSPT